MGQANFYNEPFPRVPQFFSRPDLQPPKLQVNAHDVSWDNQEYIFLAPSSTAQLGPYIYDLDGNLVWSGFGMPCPSKVHGPHICAFQGTPHLCFFTGNQIGTFARGHGVVMNSEYRVVATVSAAGIGIAGDLHEFSLTPGGDTALITIYCPRQFEINKDGILEFVWVMESIFQEVNVSSGELLFEWHSLDHVHPSQSYLALNTSNDGISSSKPWDYFHINSVEKNSVGDYLISGRHTHCIYKISGKNGSILWQLQGKNSSFLTSGFTFAWQHDARWLQENSTTTVVSFFDNGRTQDTVDSGSSSGKIISISHENATASLITQFDSTFAPRGLISSISQGNLQSLDNGNVFIGWGAEPFISEHLSNGTTVWSATWDDKSPNYRAFKGDWNGCPNHTIPAIWSYARTNSSRTAIYVSWNGATNVHSWAVYTAALLDAPATRMAITVKKTGFETLI
ncbi:ASST-domain-containing protein [Bisporella sp. PMI_857]|nr:ASST-domain-containing protein [Bisporella sp. PMI_857]